MIVRAVTKLLLMKSLSLLGNGEEPAVEPEPMSFDSLRRLSHACGPWKGVCCADGGQDMTNCYKACNGECISSWYGQETCEPDPATCLETHTDCTVVRPIPPETLPYGWSKLENFGTGTAELFYFFWEVNDTCGDMETHLTSCLLVFDSGVDQTAGLAVTGK
jgi:hypothetical protein